MTSDAAELIDSIAHGYRDAQVLFTACRLGLFERLAAGAQDVTGLARQLGTDVRGTRILCDALVGLGLLEKEGDTYRNGNAATDCLLPGSPRSKHASLLHAAKLYERWARLDDAVTSGAPIADDRIDPRLIADEAAFAAAMADVGRVSATLTADALDLAGVASLLDLGGGPGIYSIEFARRHPGLEVVIFDTPATLEVALRNVAEAGLANRISARPGDIFADDIGGPYDLIFTSNLLHIYGSDQNRDLIARCAKALEPGGRLCIKDFVLANDRTSPPGATLFAVNMLLSTDHGDCYTGEEMGDWLATAGLELETLRELTPQSSLLCARKPAA